MKHFPQTWVAEKDRAGHVNHIFCCSVVGAAVFTLRGLIRPHRLMLRFASSHPKDFVSVWRAAW